MTHHPSTVFLHLSSNFQFLSVCHYITSFGLLLYNNHQLTFDQRNQTLPVINALFDHLNKSSNESETKLQILQKVLKGTDFYGGGENETLDMKYVNETYQYIISTALFSHYGNITFYLAKIINQLDNVDMSVIKKTVLKNLTKNYVNYDYCSRNHVNITLTPLAIDKIFNNHIWTIFPESEINTTLIDVNYLYAMAGLKMMRSISANKVSRMLFNNYILIARRIEFLALKNKDYLSALEIFSTPVLFFYAYIEKSKFSEIKELTTDFWNTAYEVLFSYLNVTVHGIIQNAIESSLYYKLENELRNLNSRTIIASNIIKDRCHYKNLETAPKFFIGMYKMFFPILTKYLLPTYCDVKNFPDLHKEYTKEFTTIRNMYFEIMKNSLKRLFESKGLMETLERSQVSLGRISKYALRSYITLKNFILFGVKQNDRIEFFLLNQENSVMNLLERNKDKKKFVDTLSFDPADEKESALFERILKKDNETTDVLINNLAEIKTGTFIEVLMNYYKEPIAGEKIVDFFSSFIPFFNCFHNLKYGKRVRAALTCSMEVLHFVPLPLSLGKYTTLLETVFSLQTHETELINDEIKEIGNITGLASKRSSFSPIFRTAKEKIENIKRRKEIIHQLASISQGAINSGSEVSYHLSKFGEKFTKELLENILSMTKRHATLYKIDVPMRKLYFYLIGYEKVKADSTGLVPEVIAKGNDGRGTRYYYPGGENLFGPRCLTLFHKQIQLRSMRNRVLEMFFVPSEGKTINPKTGKMSTCSLTFDNNDMLHYNDSSSAFTTMECDFNGLLTDNDEDDQKANTKLGKKNYPEMETFDTDEDLGEPSLDYGDSSKNQREDNYYAGSLEYDREPEYSRPSRTGGKAKSSKAKGSSQGGRRGFEKGSEQGFGRGLGGNGFQESGEYSNEPDWAMSGSEDTFKESEPTRNSARNFRKLYRRKRATKILDKTSEDIKGHSNFAASANVPKAPEEVSKESDKDTTKPVVSTASANVPKAPEEVSKESDKDTTKPVVSTASATVSKAPEEVSKESAKDTTKPTVSTTSATVPKAPGEITKESAKVSGASITLSKYTNPPETPGEISKEPLKDPNGTIALTASTTVPKEPGEVSKESAKDTTKPTVSTTSATVPKAPGEITKESAKVLGASTTLSKSANPPETPGEVSKEPLEDPNGAIALTASTTVPKEPGEVSKESAKVLGESTTSSKSANLSETSGTSTTSASVPKGPGEMSKEYAELSGASTTYSKSANLPESPKASKKSLKDSKASSILGTSTKMSKRPADMLAESDKDLTESFSAYGGLPHEFKDNKEKHQNTAKYLNNRSKFAKTADSLELSEDESESLQVAGESLGQYKAPVPPKLTKKHLPEGPKRLPKEPKHLPQSSKHHSKLSSEYNLSKQTRNHHPVTIINLSYAKIIIDKIYSGIYEQDITNVYNLYENSSSIAKSLQFEDYYALQSHAKNILLFNKDTNRRMLNAIYKLSLQQQEETWIMQPIVLYRIRKFTPKIYEHHQLLKRTTQVHFGEMKIFSENRDREVENHLNETVTILRKPILFQVHLKNQHGVADIGRVINDEIGVHAVPSGMKFVIEEIVPSIINKQEVLIIKMHDLEISEKEKMKNVEKEIQMISQSGTKIYANGN
ncbi:uncharacterized protein LOC122512851 [Leptopilina heterotoma]|uniref:uncharacterized protein LOC122512851 n=1 Tax=Leptopilina heterotoma TaxID=63436 RepID=UPI001CA8806F|nr:uncharacterized protein LOC122512851 [Leptopilina heterotoma]